MPTTYPYYPNRASPISCPKRTNRTKLLPFRPARRFGFAVSVHGNLVLIGDPGHADVGRAHLFDAVSGMLLHTFSDPMPRRFDDFGQSVSVHGNHVVVGAPDDDTNGDRVGQAYLFDATTGALLHTFDDPTITALDVFGYAVSVHDEHVLVGAHGDDTLDMDVGQAHLFVIPEPQTLSLGGLAALLALVAAHRRLQRLDQVFAHLDRL